MSQSLRSFFALRHEGQPWAPLALGSSWKDMIVRWGTGSSLTSLLHPHQFSLHQFSNPESVISVLVFQLESNFQVQFFQHSIVFPLTFQPQLLFSVIFSASISCLFVDFSKWVDFPTGFGFPASIFSSSASGRSEVGGPAPRPPPSRLGKGGVLASGQGITVESRPGPDGERKLQGRNPESNRKLCRAGAWAT